MTNLLKTVKNLQSLRDYSNNQVKKIEKELSFSMDRQQVCFGIFKSKCLDFIKEKNDEENFVL